MAKVTVINRGEDLPFVFDLDGEDITNWTCTIVVRKTPEDPILITREIEPVGNTWPGFLTSTETSGLDPSLYYLVGVLVNTVDNLQRQEETRFQITADWTDGAVIPLPVPPTPPIPPALLGVILYGDIIYVNNSDSPITLTDNDNGSLYVCNTSLGDITLNLPDTSLLETDLRVAAIKNTSDANEVIFAAFAGQTIDGNATKENAIPGQTLTPAVGNGIVDWTTIYNTPPALPVDETDTDPTKNKLVSNLLANGWEAGGNSLYKSIVPLAFSDSPVTLVEADDGKLFHCDTTAGNIVINLPLISGLSGDFRVGATKIDASANQVSLVSSGGDTINANASIEIKSQYDTLTPTADTASTDWIALFSIISSFDIDSLPAGTLAVADEFAFSDVTDSNIQKKATIQDILDLFPGGTPGTDFITSLPANGNPEKEFTLDFTQYHSYKFTLKSVYPSVAAKNLRAQVRNNGGAYIAGTSYDGAVQVIPSDGTAPTNPNNEGLTDWEVSPTTQPVSNVGALTGVFLISSNNDTAPPTTTWELCHVNTAGTGIVRVSGGGRINTTVTTGGVDRLKLFYNGANINGTITQEGVVGTIQNN